MTDTGRYEVEVRRDVRIPTCDPQVTLSADVSLPVGADPGPALVMVLPYRKDLTWGFFDASFHWFAEHGYACVLVDLGGIGSSDGSRAVEWDPGEGDDCVAAIEWAAAQPWCSGNVGMWGISYGGFTTLRAASRRPPQLKAIIPMMTLLDPERDHLHPDGARSDVRPLANRGGHMLMEQLLPPLLNHSSVPEQHRWLRRLNHVEPGFLDFVSHGTGDPVWRDRVIDAESITVPAFCVGGWRDLVCDPTTRAFEKIQGPKKLLMGPWMHTMPQDSPFEPIDFLSIALRWWDHWLRGVDNGVMDEPPITLYAQGGNPPWRSFESWPPAKGELVLVTGTDTTLTESARKTRPATEAIAEYQPDPTTGALSGLRFTSTSGFEWSLDQHDDDIRALSATSEPLSDDLVICGRPEVTVRLARANSRPAIAVERLVVRLAEVDSQGRSTLITTGVLCPDAPKETYRIVLGATLCRVRARRRLRVQLSDSDFPQLTPLPNPSPIPVASIELSAPTMPEDVGPVVDMPTLEKPTSEAPQHGRRWTITRDLIHDGIEVAIAWGTPATYTSQGHLLEMLTDLRSTVRRAAPEAVITSGTHTAVVRMSTGEDITVTATVRCTQAGLWARGEVSIDDITIFSRIWEAPLEHSNHRQ